MTGIGSPMFDNLPAHDQQLIQAVTGLYADIDNQVDSFCQHSGLSCKSGCGACCENPHIETTVTEVMPLAFHVLSTGKADETAVAIESPQIQGRCVFYQPDPAIPHHGRCGIYAHRPGICRLFGFSAKKDKHGRKQMVTCPTIKTMHADTFKASTESINAGMPVPLVNEYGMKVISLDPVRGSKLMPINQAVRQAIERLSFYVK